MNTSHQPVLFEIRSFYNIYLWDAKLVLCWLKQGIKDKIIGSLVFMTQMEVAVKTVLGGLKKKKTHTFHKHVLQMGQLNWNTEIIKSMIILHSLA